jgi:hypothetical protein
MPINSATAFAKNYSGAHGNASRSHLFGQVAAAPINETLILGTFDAGTTIDEVRVNHAAMGANAAFDLGYVAMDGTVTALTAFLTNQASATVGIKKYEGAPVPIGTRFQLVLTIKGAVQTGRYDVLVDYRYEGISHKIV